MPPQQPPGFQSYGAPWHPPLPGPVAGSGAVAGATPAGGDGVATPPAVPDIHLEQLTPFADGTEHVCVVEVSALPDGTTEGGAQAAARATLVLSSVDWGAVLASPPPLPPLPFQQPEEGASGEGIPEADRRANELLGRVTTELWQHSLPDGYALYAKQWCE
jgi:hypothetical protein